MEDGFGGFRIGVAGLGLIGGSLARAFKRAGLCVCGFDISRETVAQAQESGVFEECLCEPSAVLKCDVIFVALYPDGIINFVTENKANFKKGAVVIDCCGIKSQICEKLFEVTKNADFKFIGGHPMAGTELCGFSATFDSLFDGASFILTPREGEDENLLEKVRSLILKAGFRNVVVTTPEHHDRMIAFTSQLPHVIACSYVMSSSCPGHESYSAGSYRDVSRIAHINAPLWAKLLTYNRNALVCEIDELIGHIKSIRNAAASDDIETLTKLLQNARSRKDNFG